jgi:hypothetical protein
MRRRLLQSLLASSQQEAEARIARQSAIAFARARRDRRFAMLSDVELRALVAEQAHRRLKDA